MPVEQAYLRGAVPVDAPARGEGVSPMFLALGFSLGFLGTYFNKIETPIIWTLVQQRVRKRKKRKKDR